MGVHLDDELALRGVQADVESRGEIAGRVLQDPHARLPRGELVEDRAGAVLGGAVDHQELGGPVEALVDDPLGCLADERGLVADRHEHTHVDCGWHSGQ